MKVGDLVRHIRSESGLMGIIVGWHDGKYIPKPCPVVLWLDGRTSWVMSDLVKVIA